MVEFGSWRGSYLRAALADRQRGVRSLIPAWQAAKAEKAMRLRTWTLATRLVALGATDQSAAIEAIRAGRTLLTEPDPLPALVSAATDDLRGKANAAYAAWKTAWEAGEARLKADEAWNKLAPEQKRQIRLRNELGLHEAPELSTPEKIADSLSARKLSEWRNMALALPPCVDAALRDAALEVEPKTQYITIARRVIRTEPDLDSWLAEL